MRKLTACALQRKGMFRFQLGSNPSLPLELMNNMLNNKKLNELWKMRLFK